MAGDSRAGETASETALAGDGERRGGDTDVDATADAFQRLGNEQRLAVLDRLAADGPQPFSALADDSDADSSAGFAYHLRQLDDQFVRKRDDEQYELTAAGRDVVHRMQAGTLTDRTETAVDLDRSCPLCGEAALSLDTDDGVATVTCRDCDSAVLKLPVPPGTGDRAAGSVPDALDSYHRNRISTFADGVCPDCGGAVSVAVETADVPLDEETAQADPVQVEFDCDACDRSFACPATLTVLDHPAVVSFYADHDESLDERPLWNVGSEWRERLVSRDPWCLLVNSRLDDELLDLYLGPDASVHEWRRRPVPADANGSTQQADEREDVAA